MELNEIESICNNLLNELSDKTGQNSQNLAENIVSWIMNRTFHVHREYREYPEQSIYVTQRETFDHYLGNMSSFDMREVCLYIQSRILYRDKMLKYGPILSLVSELPEFSSLFSEAHVVDCPYSLGLFDDILQGSTFCYHCKEEPWLRAGSSWDSYFSIEDFKRDKTLVIASELSLDVNRYGRPGRLPSISKWNYIGICKKWKQGQGWSGTELKERELLKAKHEKMLIHHDVTFYQYGDVVLEYVSWHPDYANSSPQTMKFVDLESKEAYKARLDVVDSFIPEDYKNNQSVFSASRHIAKAKSLLDGLTNKYSSLESKYDTAWDDNVNLQVNMYLDRLRRERLIDENYQSPKQSVMQAIAAAVSYRTNLFKYKRNFAIQIPTLDFEKFILPRGKNGGWAPGRFSIYQPARTVDYIWDYWRCIFNFFYTEKQPASSKAALRSRIYDNRFSIKLKRKIAESMLAVEEENRSVFPVERFPQLDLSSLPIK